MKRLLYIVEDDSYADYIKKNSFEDYKVILSVSEAIDILSYQYDCSAVFYLCNERGYSYDHANFLLKEIRNLKASEFKNIKSLKVRELFDLRDLLIEQGLLDYSYKRELFFNHEVLLKGHEYSFKEIEKILLDLNIKYTTEYEPLSYRVNDIYSYRTRLLELIEGLNYICKIVEDESSYEDVYIVAPSDIHSDIRAYASLFELPIIDAEVKLSSLPFCDEIVLKLINNEEIDQSDDVRDYLRDVIIYYYELARQFYKDKTSLFDYIKDSLDNEFLPNKLNKGVKLVSSFPAKAKFCLILDFSDTSISSIKDSSYLSDKQKEIYANSLTSYEFNENNHARIISIISSYENKLILSSIDLKEFSNKYFNVKYSDVLSKFRFSKEADLILLSFYHSQRIKYGEKNDLEKYLEELKLGTYADYKSDMTLKLPYNPEKYSYSSLSKYIDCPFSFYLEKILNVNDIKSQYSFVLGNILHEIVEKYIVKNEIVVPKIDCSMLDVDEKYFLNRRVEEFIKNIDKFDIYKDSIMNKHVEYVFDYKFDDSLITGRYDLLLEDQNDIIIVDFKTTDGTKFKLSEVKYGSSLQLPLYYLSANSIFAKKKCLACLIQPLEGELMKSKGTGFITDLAKTTVKLNTMIPFEKYFVNATKKSLGKGFILTDEQKEELVDNAKFRIKEAIGLIKEGDFKIAPLKIGRDKSACRFCTYRDICLLERASTKKLRVNKG